MRYDLIDLQGILKIQGNTGSDSLGLGYSGSNVDWIESQLPGPTYSFLRNSGYNYFIVGATGTPQENAQGLLDVNGIISSIWTDAPSIDNRFTILLTPGEYDFALTPNELVPVEFTDYIGLSSNPYHTILRNSVGGRVIYEDNGFDFGLENVYLPGDGYCYAIAQSYPRWKNVVFGGITFDLSNPWPDIRGIYENIIIESGSNAFYSTITINGIFKEIFAKNVNSIFITSDSIGGTFSNIYIDGIETLDSFLSTDEFSGVYENIEIDNAEVNLFSSRQVSGKFKNLKFKNVKNIFEPGVTGMINVYFENIEVDGATNVFYSLYSVSGTFKKINLKNISTSVFNCGDFQGEIDNLEVSQSNSCSILNCGSTIDGIFKNINVDGSSIFTGLTIFGTYSNINTLNTDSFQGDTIVTKVSDSKFLGDFYSLFVSDTLLSVDAQNLRIGNSQTSCFEAESIYGRISDIEFLSCSSLFSADVLISCTISNIYGFNVTGNCFQALNSQIDGTYGNIRINDVGGNFFVAGASLNCDVRDIKVGNITGGAYIGSEIIGKKFRNITLGNCLGDVFNCSSFDSPDNFFENIEVGDIGGGFFISNGKFDGTYQKIKAGVIVGDFFKTTVFGEFGSVNMKGWYKDIEIISCDEAFQIYPGDNQFNNIRIENVKINNCGLIMKGCKIGESVVIRNLWVVGDWSPNEVYGSVENCFIDRSYSEGSGIPALQDGFSVIKRSKILSIPSKAIYWNGLIYLSEFNYIGNDTSSFYNQFYNMTNVDIE